jgi:hypothetical protein
MPAASQFEHLVRGAMDRQSLSMLQLGRDSRIPPQRWYAWFRGENQPSPRVLARATTILGLSVEELLAPYGGMPRPGVVTDPGLGALTEAINRLADVLSGQLDVLQPEVEAGIARARGRARSGSPRRSQTRQ